MMKASLRKADLVEENDHELKEWIRQVRDIAYDTEDVIDQFKLHRPEQEDKIRAFLHKFCCTIEKLQGRHQIAAELQQIRARITNVLKWQQNYVGKLNKIEQGSSSSTAGDDALLLNSTDLVGIGEPKEQLIRWLAEGNCKRNVISVVGMGGSGKTTLVKQVYDAIRVKKHFTVHAWITVSQPLRMKKLLRQIVQQLYSAIRKPIPEGVETMSQEWLKQIIKSFLQTYRYLIVLDNVWNIQEWHALNYALANNNFSSRVILTTRKADVALYSCIEPEDQIFNMLPLSQEASWALFCRRSFRGSACPPYLDSISKRISERCEGLPLAIVAISGVLATKRQEIAEWETVLRSLGAEIEYNDKLKSMKEVLLLSFNDLPYHLKSCFLYLSIFPEHHLNELLNRSLIQVATRTSDGRVKTCRIHDLLREIVISKSKDQNFAVVAKEQDSTLPEKVRRLSIHSTMKNVQRNRNVSPLRSLFLFGVEDPLSDTPLLDPFPNLLKVLDLRGARLEVFPVQITKLRLLKYLSLRDTMIKTIPSSIEQLQNLETLDLKHTYVTELPIQIRKLNQLRHLLAYRYEFKNYSRFHSNYGFKALAGIGSLRFLQKLSFIEADHGNPAFFAEIGKLIQLRRLGIMNLRKNDGEILCGSIEKLINLQSLSVVSSTKDEVIDLQNLSSPPPYLQRLYLTGRLERIPDWICSLQSLVIIYLKWSRLNYDPLESLQHLPNLIHLELLQVCQGETLLFRSGGFQKLKVLGIDKFEELKCINDDYTPLQNAGKSASRNRAFEYAQGAGVLRHAGGDDHDASSQRNERRLLEGCEDS